MNQSQPSHPTPEQLAAFGLGRLDATTVEFVGSHLEACADCRFVVENLADDDLAALVRSAASSVSGQLPPTRFSESMHERKLADLAAVFANHPRYQIIELIGRGGMGVVYKARHKLMERMVALKIISAHLLDNPGAIERFRREVKAAAALSHPNIVTAFDAESVGEFTFLAMEYVPGRSLHQVVSEDGPLPVARACKCVRQTAQGLQHAFENGMIHRDIKPPNLMLTAQGRVKILDFGLARLRDHTGSLTGSDSIVGTPDYLAPEQADNPRSVDIRADLYSLGCTLYFLLTGQPPFPGGSVMQKLKAHAERQPKSITTLRPEVPRELEQLLERLLAKSPDQRFQTPAELVAALASLAVPAPIQPQKTRKLSPALLALALIPLVLVAVGALILVVVWRPSSATSQTQLGTGTVTVATTNHGNPLPFVPASANIKEVNRWDAHSGKVDRLALNADGDKLATVGNDGALRLWNLRQADKKPIWEVKGGFLVVTFSPDGQLVAAGGYEQTVHCYATSDGATKHTFGNWSGALRALVFSRDSQLLYAGGEEGRLRCFDCKTNSARTLAEFPETVGSLALSPNDEILAVGTRENAHAGLVALLDAKTGTRKHVLETAIGEYPVVAINSTGTLVAAGGMAKHLKLWDIPTGKVHAELRGPHSNIMGLAFSKNGSWLVSADGSYDNHEKPCSLKLWNVERGQEVDRLVLAHGCFYGVVFASDGRSCYAALHDGTVRQYALPIP
jgi:serine/threonine protein kinase